MKKLVFFNLSMLLLLSPAQNLNLSSLMAQPTSCIENNPQIAKILDACQNNSKLAQEKISKVARSVKIKLLCMCNLSEKLQLRDFTKNPTLFEKLFSEFVQNAGNLLNIEYDKINAIAQNLQFSVKAPVNSNKKGVASSLNNGNKKQIIGLATKVLNISNDKLNKAIALIVHFLDPISDEKISQADIMNVLTRTLSPFTPEELNAVEKIISTKAFEKIANNLDILTEIVLSIIKEDA